MEDTNKLNSLRIEIKNEREIINKLMQRLQRLDELWGMRLKHEEHLNENNETTVSLENLQKGLKNT